MTLGIAVIACVLLLRVYRKMRKMRKESPDLARFETTRHAVHASEQVALWEVEIEEKLRRIEARLDNKIAALEYLVGEAESVSQALEGLIEEQRRGR